MNLGYIASVAMLAVPSQRKENGNEIAPSRLGLAVRIHVVLPLASIRQSRRHLTPKRTHRWWAYWWER